MSRKALLVGISGVSSSGKTTLARLIRDIFPSTQILHEDDFYKTDVDIPVNSEGIADWDCLESLNLPALESALAHIKNEGRLPTDLFSKEDKNSVGPMNVDDEVLVELRERAHAANQGRQTLPIIIIDGFLLFSEDMKAIRELFDVKLFLRTDYKTAKHRREARSGYVTLEGFWEDPPGYVDTVVWPNYVKEHAFLFKDGNVEGELKTDVCSQLGLQVMPLEAQGNMSTCLQWAYEVVDKAVLETR